MATQSTDTPGTGYGSEYVDATVWGCEWLGGPISFSFGSGENVTLHGSWTTWDCPAWVAAEKQAVREVLDSYANVCNLSFEEVAYTRNVDNQSDIVLHKVPGTFFSGNTVGQHEVPDETYDSIYGYFDATYAGWSDFSEGSEGYWLILHELGHAMGLAHPHDGGSEDDATVFAGVTGSDDLGDNFQNQGIYTVMSYGRGAEFTAPGDDYGRQVTPMAFDIAALQALYGANLTYHSESNTYVLPDTNGAGTYWSCIWDVGGTDTLSNAGSDRACVINLNEAPLTGEHAGGYVSSAQNIAGGFTIAHNVTIEKAIGGSGRDKLIGNAAANTLDGRGGTDTLEGGAGNDLYIVERITDLVRESANHGTDTVRASATHTLRANVEHLILQGNAAIDGTGNGLANRITGNLAANVLDGGSGRDTLAGGGGHDTYVVDNAADVVSEADPETGANAGGTDTVRASVSYTLGSDLENLVLTGQAALNGTGNAQVNHLSGNDANNRLDGQGGADTLSGGAGDDVYVVDQAGDVVDEAADSGNDTVETALANYQLGPHVENLTLTGNQAIHATGTARNNRLTGNDAANTLDGLAGADTLTGQGGDDSYVVDHVGDVIVETAGEGNDSVRASVSYTLSAHVERLQLTGNAALNATGNGQGNRILGNEGANQIDGGAGVDTLSGGRGNDTYWVDEALDSLSESAGEGTDSVIASVTRTLENEVEHLTLTGNANLAGYGNAANNHLTGNAGDNTLTGQSGHDTLDGGSGADFMLGGAGSDVYIVDASGDWACETISAASEVDAGGDDGVRASVTHTLTAYIEELRLTGSRAIDGTGNALDNLIVGNSAANVLDGAAGSDTLRGGKGHDTYVVDAAGDVIEELADQGSDTVQSSLSWTLAAHFEHLRLSGENDLDGTGNTLSNQLTGNAGANVLSGLAGDDRLDGDQGDDLLIGGSGNDTYLVDSLLDEVRETLGATAASGDAGGLDSVYASVDYTLGRYQENLILEGTASGGKGNTLANTLTGNAGANLLKGMGGHDSLLGGDGNDTLEGGTGNDTLRGGSGDDTYYVDSVTDALAETLSPQSTKDAGGSDSVYASVGHTLGLYFENLTLTGPADIDATGNDLDNTLTGNLGDNRLDGGEGNDTLDGSGGNDTLLGGTGSDLLTGGEGNDIFVFMSVADSGNSTLLQDVISDFSWGDVLDFSAIDARTDNLGDDAFTFLGTQTPVDADMAHGALWYQSGLLFGSTDADLEAEFSVQVTAKALSATDILL